MFNDTERLVIEDGSGMSIHATGDYKNKNNISHVASENSWIEHARLLLFNKTKTW